MPTPFKFDLTWQVHDAKRPDGVAAGAALALSSMSSPARVVHIPALTPGAFAPRPRARPATDTLSSYARAHDDTGEMILDKLNMNG